MIQKPYYRKDMKDMSFVGLHNTNEGIIAFADSKSTIYSSDEFQKDINRGEINKIFQNQYFIFVTYGNNQLFSEYKKKNIEDYIQEHLTKTTQYDTFFDELLQNLKIYPPEYNDGEYNFIIGGKDDRGYFLRELYIRLYEEEQMIYSPKNYQKIAIYGGEEKYQQMYNIIPKYYDFDIVQYSKIIKQQVEKMIDIFELDAHYNSVGKPVQVELFQ